MHRHSQKFYASSSERVHYSYRGNDCECLPWPVKFYLACQHYIAFLSVSPLSVHPCVYPMPICCLNEWTHHQNFMTMWGHPHGLLQSSGGTVDRILLASALLSIRAMCPKGVRRHDWTIAVSLGCPVSLQTSSFRTNACSQSRLSKIKQRSRA